jgi:hypothetical protein
VLALLLCDDQDRMQVPVVAGDLPAEMTDDDRQQTIATVVAPMARGHRREMYR